MENLRERWRWGEETNATQAATEQAIAGFCIDALCQADAGAVIGPDDQTYNIEVRARLVPTAGEDAAPPLSLYLMIVWADTEPEIRGPFPTDEARLEAARKHRAEEDTSEKRNGLYRLDTAPGGPTAEPFYGWEMSPEEEGPMTRADAATN